MKKVAILGSTGYVGQELVRLLLNHPYVSINQLTSHSYEGARYSKVYPNFNNLIDNRCIGDELEMVDADVLFIALPHGHSSKVVSPDLLKRMKVIDLGADFRINIQAYDKWYGVEHFGMDVMDDAVYGLSEWYRESIANARLIANPGCYVTCSLLVLLPLLKEKLIDPNQLIIDAKSGITGAGRTLQLATHYTECNESIKAYNLTTHRHTPEIEEQLSKLCNTEATVLFTPHLVPMNRGILSTIYVKPTQKISDTDLLHVYSKYYQAEKFIRLIEKNVPETRFVKGSNYCDIHFKLDSRTNSLILVSAIDNMMKGAASQAIQNMNIMMGWEEEAGINMAPLFPA